MSKKGLLVRLDEGVVIGDGGFVFALEKRGYVKAGPWTPEATVENPEAVRQLHREFLRAGSDVMQTFTFYASEDKLENRGNEAQQKHSGGLINQKACDIAHEVAKEGDALVAGGLSQTPTYLNGLGKEAVQKEFEKQLAVFVDNKVDFMIAEYFEHVEEIVWAVESIKKFCPDMPIASTMCIGPEGDMHGVSTGECAVKMAEAGSDVIGINCHFDPDVVLAAIKLMKTALENAGHKKHLMTQPLGFKTPDAGKQGFIDLPEFPFCLEPRILTRWDCHRYAREAYNLGVRYIGACCGFEPYHVRAIAEELTTERGGRLPAGSVKHGMWGDGLRQHTKPWVRARARREYWENMKPASGRPYCSSLAKPDEWGVTQGDELLKQQAQSTTNEDLGELFTRK